MLSTVVLEKTLENLLDCKEIQPVSPKGNQFWIFIGRTDAEGEVPVLWPSNMMSRLTGKDSYAGKDWRQEKGVIEDEMAGWHHRLNGHEFEQTLEPQFRGKLSKLSLEPGVLQSIGLQRVKTWLSDLTNIRLNSELSTYRTDSKKPNKGLENWIIILTTSQIPD